MFVSYSRLRALRTVLVLLLTGLLANSCTSFRTRDIPYVASSAADSDAAHQQLDVYAPRKQGPAKRPVVVFIHGGNWNSGSKSQYGFIGRELARQGMVAVIVDYRLSPAVQVPAMAADCARAVQWTVAHIAEYNGDPNRIFLMGHSAGGGLAALLATDNTLFTQLGFPTNPVRGAVLNDPAGLDMYDYLKKMQYPGDRQYLKSFGNDPAGWRQVSAMHHVTAASPPFLLFVGGHTYPSILHSSEAFRQRLQELGKAPGYTLQPGKNHIPMVLQLFWHHNIIYRQLRPFVGL
ncbi:alpha/beta hydrolase [Hymenobacter sp. DG25B]|jgi:acetyl esterase/lipase|uniref:alpha/beta hydrolase n=1 Tax=Hymenobacter sp. DG25B TaxID=1385664 RepID=UPI0005CB2D3C|nr:alpha/beta hydrolase [Hymenobacter sp. DG25B]